MCRHVTVAAGAQCAGNPVTSAPQAKLSYGTLQDAQLIFWAPGTTMPWMLSWAGRHHGDPRWATMHACRPVMERHDVRRQPPPNQHQLLT